jgi:hypothetical protein
MTAYKAQGATMAGKVLLVLTDAFIGGLGYVMLSRVTNRKNLRIVGRFTLKDL